MSGVGFLVVSNYNIHVVAKFLLKTGWNPINRVSKGPKIGCINGVALIMGYGQISRLVYFN